MKLQLVATVLFVGCMLAPSLAVAGEEEEAKAVLQVLRTLLASENHGRSEVQQANGQCVVADNKKVECGYFGITQTQCEENCCCWSPTNASGVPYCFQKIETAARCQTNDRVECGYLGITKVQCWRRGCCYSPTTAMGQPWCYHEKATAPECQTAPASRVECGYLGINATQCTGSGCCWSPTSVSGAPWCFTKSSAPTAAAKFAYFGKQKYQRS